MQASCLTHAVIDVVVPEHIRNGTKKLHRPPTERSLLGQVCIVHIGQPVLPDSHLRLHCHYFARLVRFAP